LVKSLERCFPGPGALPQLLDPREGLAPAAQWAYSTPDMFGVSSGCGLDPRRHVAL
jgi:hypothetical protein